MNLEGLWCSREAQAVFMSGEQRGEWSGRGPAEQNSYNDFFTHEMQAVIFMSSSTKLHLTAAFDVALPGVLP